MEKQFLFVEVVRILANGMQKMRFDCSGEKEINGKDVFAFLMGI